MSIPQIESNEWLAGLHDALNPNRQQMVLFYGHSFILRLVQRLASKSLLSNGQELWILDGANVFDPYLLASQAMEAGYSAEDLLPRIHIARSFTAHQMLTLMKRIADAPPGCSPCLLLGPLTSFYDENIPRYEARTMFGAFCRELKRLEEQGLPLLLACQQPVATNQRLYVRPLLELADVVVRGMEAAWLVNHQPQLTGIAGQRAAATRGKKECFTVTVEKPVAARKRWLLAGANPAVCGHDYMADGTRVVAGLGEAGRGNGRAGAPRRPCVAP